MPPIRRTIFYTGQVQGVGFRWTTVRVLRGLELSGYVRNLPDGRVELRLEGTAQVLDQAEARVRQALGGYFHESEAQTSSATGEFDGFGIRQ